MNIQYIHDKWRVMVVKRELINRTTDINPRTNGGGLQWIAKQAIFASKL